MRLTLCAIYVFMGAVVFAIPNTTRRKLLFAVPVPPGFRESRAGRRAILMFRGTIAAFVLAGVSALLLSSAQLLSATATAVSIALVLAGCISFYWQNRKLAPAALHFTGPREMELTAAPEELPWFAWLAIGPFVILAAAARWLFVNWNRIPARFPVHFGEGGQPNGWAERTTKGVYGPLLFGAELCAWILMMALACWFGSRRLRSRPVMLGGMIAIQYFLGMLFVLIALQAPFGIPVWVMVLSPMAFLIPLLIVMTNKMGQLGEPMDPTPTECWRGGIFYYNPNDAALMVEKREGLGYAFNFANQWSWMLLLCLVLVIASARFVMG
jgi:uncharacterized membrane protein